MTPSLGRKVQDYKQGDQLVDKQGLATAGVVSVDRVKEREHDVKWIC